MSPYSTVDMLHFAINFSGVGASYNRKLTGIAPRLLGGELKRLGEFPPPPSYSVVRKVGKTELAHLEGVGAGLCGKIIPKNNERSPQQSIESRP